MANRYQCEGSNDVGVFAKLTNSYCLCGLTSSSQFYSSLEWQMGDSVPVIRCCIAGCRIVGRLTVGNRHGLLVPNTTTDQEIQFLRNALPDNVKIQRVEERLSALGNVIVSNDHVALAHPELDKETEEILGDTLNVEVFRNVIAGNALVGTYSVITNRGGLVHPRTTKPQLEELASLLQVPLLPGTVNRGSDLLAAGLACNDWTGICGMNTSAHELDVINSIFKLTYTKDHWDSITKKNTMEMLS
ncbi:hypothetical protein ACOME3_003896 [Neoechinorhynchus agilis]